MASTTTNYGFDVPTSSDLVKNGATAISTLGQDIDTFLFRPFSKNAVLNSSFDIWQRGTSVSVSANVLVYTADRWQVYNGVNQAMTVSRQATGDTTNLPFIQYCARVQRNSGQTGTTETFFTQPLESTNSIPFSNQTVTVSFYARRGTNYSPTSNNLKVNLVSGTGTDQNITTYTGGASVATVTNALTTTWTRYTVTGTVGATATELRLDFAFTPTGTASTNDYFEVTGVQLEVGNQVSPFSRNAATIQGELAACQRYYFRNNATSAYAHLGPVGWFTNGTTTTSVMLIPPVTMRTAPTSVEYGGTVATISPSAASTNISALALNQATATNIGLSATVTSVVGTLYSLGANGSTAAYIGVSAELQEMTMDNVTFIEVETLSGVETHAIIDRGNGEYTSMLKSTYDEQQAALSTPNVQVVL